jgi:mono/diheme cytochrome c family protein
VTEIPEHLLARSKARRQAIGQDEGGAPTADAPAASAAVEKAAPASTAPAGAAAAAGLAPAKAPAAPAVPAPAPKRPEVVAAETRKKIPWWAASSLLAFLLWAFIFAFTLEPPEAGLSPALAEGEHLYGTGGAGCAGCHGPQGGGGVGPAFADGAIIETFSDFNEHIEWVALGTDGWPEPTYGDTDKPVGGGGVMPAFGDSLSEEELALVVRYEREILGGYGCEPDLAELTGETCAPGTEAAAP